MSIATLVGRQLDRVARRFGHRVFPEWVLHPAQIAEIDSSGEPQPAASIPQDAVEYLRPDNPRLQEFRQAYAALGEEARTPLVWTEKFAAAPNLTAFRGDNAWVNQRGNRALEERAHVLAAYYVFVNDRLGLIHRLEEDGAFRAVTFEVAGRRVSRDLLDSILELNFLDRHISLASRSEISILDIGAGYGRLAHRATSAFPSVAKYRCTDVIAESSFVCEYYMRYRGLLSRVEVVPATEIDRGLRPGQVDLAINIHSFSECTLPAVGWWLNRLARGEVRHLMIVPNAGNHGGQFLRNNIGQDMLSIVERSGYRLLAHEPKYLDPAVQRFSMNPTCYWLFERRP